MTNSGLYVERQKSMPLVYAGTCMDIGYKLDLMVESRIVIELKAVEALNDVHLAQILTYLKLSGCKAGLLLNFNVASLKNGIRRVIN